VRSLPVPWRAIVLWLVIIGLVTLGLRTLHASLDKAHMALAFLLVVLAASAREGRFLGLSLAVVSFLTFNFFLIPPFHTFHVADPFDWGVLGSFLITGGVAAELLHRQQRATWAAEGRAREIDRLAALGAESLSVARAEEAVVAIARVIQAELPVATAEILLRTDQSWAQAVSDHLLIDLDSPAREHVEEALQDRRITGVMVDGRIFRAPPNSSLSAVLTRADALIQVIVPLRVRDQTLGVLRLANGDGLAFREDRVSFADALAHYAALAVERVRLEAEAAHVEALREADRLKDAVLASLSHDLRTPLTSIRATAAELRGEGEERAGIIEEESERLNRLVTDLLDLSRLRAGGLPTQLELNTAEDLVGAALQRVAGITGASEVQVRLPPQQIALGRFDFVHSLRALTNLLENALRYSPKPGSVEIEVRQETGRLRVLVLDRGPGISPVDRERLFEPFFRSASAAGSQGTGLGLAIADQLARAQGGRVTHHERPGGGSVFVLDLEGVAPQTFV